MSAISLNDHRVLADQIVYLSTYCAVIDVEKLIVFREEFRQVIGQYEAMGIIDGHSYFDKLKDMTARYKRLDAIILFIQVSQETEKDIRK